MAKPHVFYFNPTCELAVANGSFSYMPPMLLQEMERDLAILPIVFATENDFILTENPPASEFLEKLRKVGFKIPKFASLAELESFPSNSFETIQPWGWSPALHFKLKKIKEKCTAGFRASPIFSWTEDHRLLYERSSSLSFLINLLAKHYEPWMMDTSLTGNIVTSAEEIENLLKNQPGWVIKSPLSSSGRGIQIIRKPTLNQTNRQWISGVLNQQNYLIAEPFLDKIADLSFQYRIDDNAEIEFLGYSFFRTNSNGQYNGTLINGSLDCFFQNNELIYAEEIIQKTAKILEFNLKNSIYRQYHRGYIGIDTILFKVDDKIKIQPCIEVNCRMNMGILALKLQAILHPHAKGKFELYFNKQCDFRKFQQLHENESPPFLMEDKLMKGFLPLVEARDDQKFGAYFLAD